MKYLNIIQRFFELQFGKVLNEEILLNRFHDCLEKINKEGVSVLNDFTFFHKYLNDGVRSQKTNQNIIYGFVHFQIFALLAFLFSGLSIGVFNLLVIISTIICEYLLCWIIINIDKQNLFIHKVFNWSNKITHDLDLMNYLSLDSGGVSAVSVPFNENIYAKLWLKEMSTSMDMSWENITIELLENEKSLLPKIRVSLGGIRKSIQNADAYGFVDGTDNPIPNRLFKILMLFSRKKSIRFFGADKEKAKIDLAVKELTRHLELLFGKRDTLPIIYNEESEEWETVINIVDRSNTYRNNIKQSLDIFIKIMNSYTGNNRLL